MEFKVAQNELSVEKSKQKRLQCIIGFLFLCNFVLGIGLLSAITHQSVVLVPMGLSKTVNVGNTTLSPAYLEECALFFVNTRLNITPETVSESNALILSYTDSHTYSDFRNQLLKEEKLIESKKISSSFYVKSVRSDPQKKSVKVTGNLKRWVGSEALESEDKNYALKFSLRGGLLQLISFKELTTNQKGDV